MRVGQKKKLFTDVIGRAFGDDPSRVNGGTYVRSHYGNNDRNRSRRTTFCLKLAIKVRAGSSVLAFTASRPSPYFAVRFRTLKSFSGF